MEDFLINAGKYASSMAAIIGLVALIAYRPYVGYRKKKRETVEKDRAAQLDFQTRVLAGITSISEDVGDLQRDRLTQAHDFYMLQGYCPTDTKAMLVDMHASYTAKGRNHLCKQYEKDILSLPAQHPCRSEVD